MKPITEGMLRVARLKVSALWGVQPFRVDVKALPEGKFVFFLDGKEPPEEQTKLLLADAAVRTKAVLKSLN